MREITNIKPIEGVQAIPGDSNSFYKVFKKYIILEMKGGEGYVDYYLRPISQESYAVYAHIPELEIIPNFKHYNVAFSKFLARSKTLANLILNPSKDDNLSIVHIDDFSDENKSEYKIWCLRMLVKRKLTNDILIDNSEGMKTLDKALNRLGLIISEFYSCYNDQKNDVTAQTWTYCLPATEVIKALEYCKKENFYPPFINHLSAINPPEIRELIKKEKVLLSTESHSYLFNEKINKSEYNQNGFLFVLPEVFAPSLKDSDYIFIVRLDLIEGKWRPGVEIGDYYDFVSMELNHVDTKEKKMSPNALKMMKETSFTWFFSNEKHDGLDLYKYIEDNDTKRIYDDYEDQPVRVENRILRLDYWGSPSPKDPWEHDLWCYANIISAGCTMIIEAWNYLPVYKKEFKGYVIEKLLTGMAIGINPIGYFLKKTMKKF